MTSRIVLIALSILIGSNAVPANDFSQVAEVAALTAAEETTSIEVGTEQETIDDFGIYGADAATETMITEAIRQYGLAGIVIPELRIYVHDSQDPCLGNLGLYSVGGDLSRVDFCSTELPLIRHELAHAWERNTVAQASRDAFMEGAGIEAWNDHEEPYPARGVEQAAYIIAWGTEQAPIQRVVASNVTNKLEAYELLTGSPSPRISNWNDTIEMTTVEVEARKLAAQSTADTNVLS
jgi:hypothetical protein